MHVSGSCFRGKSRGRGSENAARRVEDGRVEHPTGRVRRAKIGKMGGIGAVRGGKYLENRGKNVAGERKSRQVWIS